MEWQNWLGPPKLMRPSSLPRNQVPEWASSYIDYKGLKKLIKTAAAATAKTGDKADLAGGLPPSGIYRGRERVA